METDGRRLGWALALVLAAPLAAAGTQQAPAGQELGDGPEDGHVERRVVSMGTLCSITVRHASRAEALAASERAVRALGEVEDRLSGWKEDSELSRLNRAPIREPFQLSPELARDLSLCETLFTETEGAFDPGLGLFARHDVGKEPADGAEDALSVRGFRGLQREGLVARRLHEDTLLDAGGFGKGVGLDAALSVLQEAGAHSAVLDFGGQVALLPSFTVERFAIADPRDRTRGVIEIRIKRGSFATSGTSERGDHILDPFASRPGTPAEDFGSTTVWSSSAARADGLSTALFVMGPERALAFAEAHDDVELLVLEDSRGFLTARASSGLRDQLEVLVEDLELVFPLCDDRKDGREN